MLGNSQPSILFVAPSAYTVGGLATWLDYLDPGLRERGWQVTVGLVEGPRFHRPDKYLAEHPHADVVRIRCDSGTDYGRVRAISRVLRRLQPDLAVSVNIPHTVLAVNECRHKLRTQSVVTLHGFQADLFDDLRRLAPACDGVIAANRLGARLAVEYSGIESERVHYAPCGTAVPEELPPARNWDDDPVLRIAWVGRLDDESKRLRDLPGILAELDRLGTRFQLRIAGSGPDEDLVRTSLAPWIATDRVRLEGYVSPATLPERIYRWADVLLITSPSEAGPIVAWEAMAHGVVVVSSRYLGSGAESSLIQGETARLFACGDSAAAAVELHRIAQSPAQRSLLRQHGFRKIRENYSERASVASWDHAIREVLRATTRNSNPEMLNGQPERSRLARLIGTAAANGIRAVLKKHIAPNDAGDEWPHRLINTPTEHGEFWHTAQALDVCLDGPGETVAAALAAFPATGSPARGRADASLHQSSQRIDS